MSAEPFSYVIAIGSIPREGASVRISANVEERRAVAEAMKIPDVLLLEGDLRIEPAAGAAFRVRGVVHAVVVQSDVVTLDLVQQEISEEVDMLLHPAGTGARAAAARRPTAWVEAAEGEERDLYYDGRLDLGRIASEHLAIGLDPYPRAAGVEFGGYTEDSPPREASPFAKLAQLKPSDE
jgi:hypothetical protein